MMQWVLTRYSQLGARASCGKRRTGVRTVSHGTSEPEKFQPRDGGRAEATLRALGVEVAHHDLCAERFEPVCGGDPLVAQHRAELAAADLVVICHPNWWNMPPAMLKGWIDRTFVPDVAYREAPIGLPPIGLLKAKALVFNTGDTPSDREREVFGDPCSGSGRRASSGSAGYVP